MAKSEVKSLQQQRQDRLSGLKELLELEERSPNRSQRYVDDLNDSIKELTLVIQTSKDKMALYWNI